MIVEIYGCIAVLCLFRTLWCWVEGQGLPWRCRRWDRCVSLCGHRVEEPVVALGVTAPCREPSPSPQQGSGWGKEQDEQRAFHMDPSPLLSPTMSLTRKILDKKTHPSSETLGLKRVQNIELEIMFYLRGSEQGQAQVLTKAGISLILYWMRTSVYLPLLLEWWMKSPLENNMNSPVCCPLFNCSHLCQ